MRLFTEEQESFIRSHAAGLLNQELADLINQKYGLSVTRQQVKTWKHNRKISSGLSGYFPKGMHRSIKVQKALIMLAEINIFQTRTQAFKLQTCRL